MRRSGNSQGARPVRQLELELWPQDGSLIVLTKSEAACLDALKRGMDRKMRIAIAARLDLVKTLACLRKLESLGLAVRDERNLWHPTRRAAIKSFSAVADRKRRTADMPGRSELRLLAALDRPMRAHELADRLGVTRQCISDLTVKLHARGLVRFSDVATPRLIVRSDDPTQLLSRADARVLGVVPHAFATSAAKIRMAAHLGENQVRKALARLVADGLVERTKVPRREALYRITADGLAHPQGGGSRAAAPPRLPVQSDRVLSVLSLMSEAGQIRIRDVSAQLGLPNQSINALFQYLKRKSLVQKDGRSPTGPYVLSDAGRQTLADMMQRRAA